MTIVLAGLSAAAIGVAFGLPSLRLRGFYLAVSTLAAQFFVQWALNKFPWFSNNSNSGVIDAPKLRSPAISFVDADRPLLFHADGRRRADRARLAARVGRRPGAISSRCATTRPRRASSACRCCETKLLAFAISSFIIGVAGVLWAFAYLRTVEPDGFNLDRSFQILFIVIIGGLATIRGAFFGAALIVVFPLLLSRASVALVSAATRLRFARHDPAHPPWRADHRLPHRRTRRPCCA